MRAFCVQLQYKISNQLKFQDESLVQAKNYFLVIHFFASLAERKQSKYILNFVIKTCLLHKQSQTVN